MKLISFEWVFVIQKLVEYDSHAINVAGSLGVLQLPSDFIRAAVLERETVAVRIFVFCARSNTLLEVDYFAYNILVGLSMQGYVLW